MNTFVDFIISVMREISSEEPVFFHRDGALFVASEQGFGHIAYGLRTKPEKKQEWDKTEQPSEIKFSEDIIIRDE